jgi:glutamyl-tRNA synthetase
MHGYDGRCRHLSRDDVQQRKRAGHKYTVRFKVSKTRGASAVDSLFAVE